ncbi:MAG: PEGA domain-containing protein, partial [Deltaproteobacteria bacterium]|nr:PEGA domain-containing protein [Deltaproteobacteria bacterium]
MNRLIEIFDKNEVRKFDDSSLPLLIGMDDTAHIRLDGQLDGDLNDEGGIIAYVAESRDHLFLQPADDTSVSILYHNDEPLTGSVWLKSGDTTRIGDSLLRWHLSGQRVEVHISKATTRVLQPPLEPPDSPQEKGTEKAEDEDILPVVEPPRPKSRRLRTLAIVLFVLLLIGAAFVLLAKPLAVTVTPAPDSLSVTGFPPPVKFGDSYLGISGSYTLHAEKEGYLPLEEAIEISAGNSQYSFTFEVLPGLIDLISTPDGVTVLIDGAAVGVTPLQDIGISAGSRTIRFEHERYLSTERVVEIEGLGKKQNLLVELEPAWAIVTLQTEPAGAILLIDGEEQGITPLKLELIAGEHQLIFTKESFTPLEVDLVVEAGQDLELDVYRLESSPATLAISSVPTGATVTVEGTFKGLTPLSIKLPSGSEHDLRLTLAGHLSANRKLKLAPGEKRQLSVTLEPQYGTVFITGTPAEAVLYIDNKKQAKTTGRFRLATRPHSIELKAKGYESVTRKVTPQSGYSQRIEIDLQRKKQASAQSAPSKTPLTAPAPANTTGIGQKLVLITPKPFLMGASRREAGRRANESEHKVTMKRSFYLSTREVTNAEYKRFQAQHSSGMSGNRSLEADAHPVANVTWDDAARFLNWLSKKDGLPPFYREENGTMVVAGTSGVGYRLPTEAEWAFAARMANQKERVRYPWPGKYPPKGKAGNFADESARHLLPVVIEGYSDGFAASAPTGSFPANPTGIQDLGGNIAEWCHDYYAANPVSGGKGAVDPMGPGVGNHHVVRGSSWRDASITELRFSYRRYSR